MNRQMARKLTLVLALALGAAQAGAAPPASALDVPVPLVSVEASDSAKAWLSKRPGTYVIFKTTYQTPEGKVLVGRWAVQLESVNGGTVVLRTRSYTQKAGAANQLEAGPVKSKTLSESAPKKLAAPDKKWSASLRVGNDTLQADVKSRALNDAEFNAPAVDTVWCNPQVPGGIVQTRRTVTATAGTITMTATAVGWGWSELGRGFGFVT